MPIYEYLCQSGHIFEVFQKTVEEKGQLCEICGAPAHRRPSLFNQSKGAGVYVFDREQGFRDVLHDPSFSERERQDAISDISRGLQQDRAS